MEIKTLNLNLVRPIEEELMLDNLVYFSKNFDRSQIKQPFPLIYLEGEYLLGDGHHRCFCLFHKGFRELPFAIIDDEDFEFFPNSSLFTKYCSTCEIINQYTNFWKEDLDRRGIKRIGDYPVPEHILNRISSSTRLNNYLVA